MYEFVYGNTILSFEWIGPLRSVIYPLLYSWPLFILKWLCLDFSIVVRYNIYLLHILYSLVGDYYFIKFGKAYFGK